jgi:alpha-mannosidase
MNGVKPTRYASSPRELCVTSRFDPGSKPAVHLICNAHLDPVWQWRWEEGASEALATFRTAVELLNEHDRLVFCHNEAVLYQWVERNDPALFKEIRKLVRRGRWAASGGWYLQPDVNMPGLESLIRQIAEGRGYFLEKFGASPKVAYNFDSFGHGGGLPQVLVRAGYTMYIHMRPQSHELDLPSDLYRWRGVDGSEILAYRIAVGLYHSERDNIEQKISEGIKLALDLDRDVPVFWGLGNHGGGATRADLRVIDELMKKEKRVRIIHSTPDRFYAALSRTAKNVPVFEDDLQRVFTGCYTSLSRIKRAAQKSLGGLVQAEALKAATWWRYGQEFPSDELSEAWRSHLFNDFHDILTGSCTEPAERDALELYGKVSDSARRLRLEAAAAFNRGATQKLYIPVTVLNANPSLTHAPVEVECMADYRPFWKGRWHLQLFKLDGTEIPCQEEQPEALLPFNRWRRKVSFMADLPGLGVSHYEIRAYKGDGPRLSAECAAKNDSCFLFQAKGDRAAVQKSGKNPPLAKFDLRSKLNNKIGLLTSLQTSGRECLAGPLFRPLVIIDDADSWGTGRSSYRQEEGAFQPKGRPRLIEKGPIRTIIETVLAYKKSRIVLHTILYPSWPVLEFRFRLLWNEERRRLKLSIPAAFKPDHVMCEIPGGAIARPADGQEHVHGRWIFAEDSSGGKETALGIVNSGQYGFDFADGEIKLSVLRSSAYCHEQGFKIRKSPARKFADIGVHEFKLLATAGEPAAVRSMLPGLADWLSAPPAAYAHLPIGMDHEALANPHSLSFIQRGNTKDSFRKDQEQASLAIGFHNLLSLHPANIRLTACKQSWDKKALIVRLHEAAGMRTNASLRIPDYRQSGAPKISIKLLFQPFEIKTVRIEKSGRWREVHLIEEK